MTVAMTTGDEAMALIESQPFAREWAALLEACPWATAFQGPAFCGIWYRIYRERFDPVVLYSRADDGTLSGLLPLAVSRETGRVVHAGAHQAEYHTWLARPAEGDAFIEAAIARMRERFPRPALVFRYLPPGAPLGWTGASRPLGGLCKVVAHRRPLMRLGDGSAATASLRKKSNRSRMGRLAHLGELQFERLDGRAALEGVIGPVVAMYDLRQGAIHDVLPFRQDPLKQPFHLAMAETPGLLHMTVWKAGDCVLSCHLGVRTHDTVHLGIVTHSPLEARHSPGKFHMLLLAQALAAAGVATIDLTPGGDPYKDRFATDFDEVHEVTVFASRSQRLGDRLAEGAAGQAKRLLRFAGLEPARVKRLGARLRRGGLHRVPLSAARRLAQQIYHRTEFRVYAFDVRGGRTPEPAYAMARDRIEDLLAYRPAEAWQTRQSFLSRALARLEAGAHVYTWAEGGRLLYRGWLIPEESDAFFPEVHQHFTFPPRSACLHDSYTMPDARGRGLYRAGLSAALCDMAAEEGVVRVCGGVLADNVPLRHVIETLGFTYLGSLYEKVVFGRAVRWRDEALAGAGDCEEDA